MRADGLVVLVDGPPAVPAVEEDSAGPRWQWIAGIAIGAMALLVIFWRVFPVLLSRHRKAKERRKQTEGYAFKQLLGALGSGDNAAAYRALLEWAERLEPRVSARTFVTRYGDDSLAEAITALSESVYKDAGTPPDLRQVRRQLAAARKRYFAVVSAESALRLPPLNP